jgi:hypothetical protein
MDGECEGFFAVHVLPSLAGEDSRQGVPIVRRGNRDGIHILAVQNSAEIVKDFGTNLRPHLLGAGLENIADGDHIGIVECTEDLLPAPPDADKSQPDPIVDSSAALTAASPREAPVRIMNLHQAKGLEAPVVFLADPTGAFSHEPQIHIDRSGGPTRGYMAIYGKTSGYHPPLLAYPEQWKTFAEEEQQFQKAEKDRLLYVATTRAGNRLIVSQREEGSGVVTIAKDERKVVLDFKRHRER